MTDIELQILQSLREEIKERRNHMLKARNREEAAQRLEALEQAKERLNTLESKITGQ